MKEYVIALDQGTTSSRAIIFNKHGNIISKSQYSLPQHYPYPGWVEHDPQEILSTQFLALNEAFEKSGLSPDSIASVGITNQRETAVMWDRITGKPIHNAIVWQCRRTAAICDNLVTSGYSDYILTKTGLVIDAYFAGTKYKWLLDNITGLRKRAEHGDILCGTIESWLIWNLTGGKVHVTDYSNASRTMLFDIDNLCWDEKLCSILDIPMNILPHPVSNSMEYGCIADGIPGLESLAGIPICGAAGDQQAALFGQACFSEGQAKSTYGTGCFVLINSGDRSIRSKNGLLCSVAWNLNGKSTYCLEGSVFNAGSTIQWLRDELGLINTAHECDILAESVNDNGGIYTVPAFTGLGAPYWDMYARGTIIGITRGVTKAHLARSVLEGIAYQVTDLVNAMQNDICSTINELRADGGASVSDFMMQFQADLLHTPIIRPHMLETTALGAAYLAGLHSGLWADFDEISGNYKTDRIFYPSANSFEKDELFKQWHRAVERAKGWEK